MSIRTLWHISRQPLPLSIHDPEWIVALRSLVEGGLVRADVPDLLGMPLEAACRPVAIVFEITRLGRIMMFSFAEEEPPSRDAEAGRGRYGACRGDTTRVSGPEIVK